MPQITVYKYDATGRLVWQWPAEVLQREEHAITLQATFNRENMELGYTTFRRGDRFVEVYYSDRWYNVFAIHTPDGRLKGWYCNVSRPARIEETAVHFEDLALDVWIDPNGTATILDEDEFLALDLSTAEQQQAQAALEKLTGLQDLSAFPGHWSN